MPALIGKKVLMVIAPKEFRDEELLQTKQVLEGAGAQVRVASNAQGPCLGMLGARVTPDVALAEASAKDYDAVVVVGGMGSPKHLWNDSKLHSLLKEAQGAGKVIGGICLSGAALAKAGVLEGKRATVWRTPESLAEMEKGKAKTAHDAVVVDGKVVTANGPEASREFGKEIARALGA